MLVPKEEDENVLVIKPFVYPKKFLFLDVDGVLNNDRVLEEQRTFYVLDYRNLNRLRTLIECTDALIVLSSYWRYNPSMVDYLTARLAEKDLKIYDMTQTIHRYGILRRNEIDIWLTNNEFVGCAAVAIDDDDEIKGGKHFEPYMIDPAVGLTDEDVEGVINLFDG